MFLNHGPERPRANARWWFLAAGAAIVLAGIIIPRASDDGGAPAALPSSSATPSPSPGPVLAGVPADAPLGFRLLIEGGSRLLAVTAGGAVTDVTLPGLESSHVMRELVRVSDTTVIVAGPVDGGPGRLYLLRDGETQPSPLGVANSVAATSQPGRVYTVTWTGGTARLAEIDLSGREHWNRTLPRTVRVVRGVAGGLLISYDEDPGIFGEELQVVDPRSGRVLRRLGSVGSVLTAGVEHVVATCGPRELEVPPDLPCKLIILDLRSGARRDYALPDERGPGPGILSPGDHLLAMSFPGLGRQANIEQERLGVVHVLDLRTGAWVQVPGVGTSFLVEPLLAWSPSGEWLALGVYWPDHKNLAYWQVGAAELQLQPGRLRSGWKQGVLPSGLVALPG